MSAAEGRTTDRVGPLERIDDYRWRLPVGHRPGMRVPGIVYADAQMAGQIGPHALEQVANVATLPGIVRASLAMPDIHEGYGFPIGGVAAFREADGVIAAGGVGYDICCGVRLVRTDLSLDDVRAHTDRLADELFRAVPSGLGSAGGLALTPADIDEVLRRGARWAVERGYGYPEDLEVTEEGGAMDGADPAEVSARAKDRGRGQLGSLGSGNHFLSVPFVEEIYDPDVARAFGISHVGQVVVLFHCGSRGLGHQVCDDHLRVMVPAARRHGIELVDRQLASAPFRSEEGQRYFRAMAAAANFAWANRQAITHRVREAFAGTFGRDPRALGMHLVYDVAHNMAKLEEHTVDGERMRVVVHRKGATRAFPAGHPAVPEKYRGAGQPIFIPGDMGRYSFVAAGTSTAMEETFGSTCHGAGRVQSRSAAKRLLRGVDLVAQLRGRGVTIRVRNPRLLAEEASEAYKDVADVVRVCHEAGISRRVAKLREFIVVKG